MTPLLFKTVVFFDTSLAAIIMGMAFIYECEKRMYLSEYGGACGTRKVVPRRNSVLSYSRIERPSSYWTSVNAENTHNSLTIHQRIEAHRYTLRHKATK